MKGSCNITSLPKALATAALCLAAVGLASCSWCWPSLHTAEAVLHCDKQVVVCITEPGSVFKYRYKGLDWYPIKLARAIDKGKSIYRRGDGAAWCLQDNTDRYQIRQESVRTFMVPCVEHCTTRVNGGMRFDQAIMEQDFPYSKAKRIEIAGDEVLLSIHGPGELCMPYQEVRSAVDGMPITETPSRPSIGQRIAATPLQVVDFTATAAMRAAEAAAIIVLLPPAAVWNGIAKLFNG